MRMLDEVYRDVQSARDKLKEVEASNPREGLLLRAVDSLLQRSERALFLISNSKEASG